MYAAGEGIEDNGIPLVTLKLLVVGIPPVRGLRESVYLCFSLGVLLSGIPSVTDSVFACATGEGHFVFQMGFVKDLRFSVFVVGPSPTLRARSSFHAHSALPLALRTRFHGFLAPKI